MMRNLVNAALAFGVAMAPIFSAGVGVSRAGAETLTFDGNICQGGVACTEYSPIASDYGSVPGVVTVSYSGANSTYPNNLEFWDTAYSDLTNVAWGGVNASTGTPEIFLKPVAGSSVTLDGFDLGAWPNSSRLTQVTIVDGVGNVLYSSGSILIDGTVHTHFTPDLTSSTGIGIEWGPDGYDVGIDNVSFTVSAVPLPAALPLFGCAVAGLGGLAAMRRRRSPQS